MKTMERERDTFFLTFFMLHASRDDGSRERRDHSKVGERNRSSSQQLGGPEYRKITLSNSRYRIVRSELLGFNRIFNKG
jgi:hypothetical protein